MASYTTSNLIAVAGEAITRGLIVYESSSTTKLLDDGADQAATQQLKPLGVAITSVASGVVPDVASATGQLVPIIAGTGGLTLGEDVYAENATARGIGKASGSLTIVSGDVCVGKCRRAAAAGDIALLELNIHEVQFTNT